MIASFGQLAINSFHVRFPRGGIDVSFDNRQKDITSIRKLELGLVGGDGTSLEYIDFVSNHVHIFTTMLINWTF